MDDSTRITSADELREHYGAPLERSLLKEIDHVSDHYRAFIDAAPFVMLATSGPEGLDCSPRGDAPGFVHVEDPHTLMLPDRRGNNRLDSLHNVIRDPRVALLFMIPGIGETLRVNGRGEIHVDPALNARFAVQGKAPASVLVVRVDRVYYQCSKALVRSRLWRAESQLERSALPSNGEILKALDESFDAEGYERSYPEHLQRTLY